LSRYEQWPVHNLFCRYPLEVRNNGLHLTNPNETNPSHEQEGAKDPQAGSPAPGKDGPRVGGCLSTGDQSREQVQPRHAGNSYTLDALSPHCSTMGRSEMGGSFVYP
jgi:hypothetical protein